MAAFAKAEGTTVRLKGVESGWTAFERMLLCRHRPDGVESFQSAFGPKIRKSGHYRLVTASWSARRPNAIAKPRCIQRWTLRLARTYRRRVDAKKP